MNNVDEIINQALSPDSVDKVYPYFVYVQTNERFPVFHFFENQIVFVPNISHYYGKAWCKQSFYHPFRKSLVPLEGDRVRDVHGDVLEIIHLVVSK